MSKPVCVIAGVGEGNGAALACAFSNEGMSVALLARGTDFSEKLAKERPDSRAYACDVSDADSVAKTFESIRNDLGDPEINSRVAQYEMAYRMQTSVPEVMDVSNEPDSVFELYGEEARKPGTFAANCLLARRMAEHKKSIDRYA